MSEEKKKKAKRPEKKEKEAKPKAVKKAKPAKKKIAKPMMPEQEKEQLREGVLKEEAASRPEEAAVKHHVPEVKVEKKPSKKEKAAVAEKFHGVGGRKTSIARVWLKPGNGKFIINGRSLEQYVCNRPILMFQAVQPFAITSTSNKYDVYANVYGGGVASQVGAIRNAISRALIEANPELRPPLRTTGMLTRDSRIKERKKYGRKKARKRFQYSKR